MAYTAEVLARARARLAQAKEQREMDNSRALQQAYRQVPRIQQIDKALKLSMVRAAQTVFERGADAKEIFDRVRQENQSLQEERKRLVEENFEPGFLDDAPICPICGGSGYMGAQMCRCLRELCRQEQQKELTVLSGSGLERFDTFQLGYYSDVPDPTLGASPRAIMGLTLETCKRYAQSFTPKSGNLLLNGNPGLGKTFLSACIAKVVADNGYSVVYESAVHLFACLEEAKFTGKEEAKHQAEKYTVCDLLIIDDLGAEMLTPFVQSALYTVLNDRLLAGAPTVVSSNLRAADFSTRYGPAIASRLLGGYRLVTFVGQDVRLQKARL